MAGAVIEIEAGSPEKLPRQRVELRAGCALGKYRARNGNVALEYEREALAHFLCRRADCDRTRNIGGAVLVLGPGIDQEQFVQRYPPISLARDPVVNNSAVSTSAGNGRKRDILE